MSPHSAGDSGEVHDRIAEATLRLVAEYGPERVTTADIIRTMGMTRAAMARHCPREDELRRTTAQFIERRMAASWGAVLSSEQSPAERLRSLLAVQIGLFMNMPVLSEFLFSRGVRGGSAVPRRGLCRVRERFGGLLRDLLRDGVRAGQFPPGLDPEKTARQLVETLQGMVVSWSLDARGGDLVEEMWARLDALVSASRRWPITAAGAAARPGSAGA